MAGEFIMRSLLVGFVFGALVFGAVLSGCAVGVDNADDTVGGGKPDASSPLPTTDSGTPMMGDASPMDPGMDSSTTMDDGATGGDDGGVDADDGGLTARIIFVTSVLYDGNLGGLAGADAKCQGLASAAKLPGMYKAWLSDSQWSASARMTHPNVPYVLVDKTVVAGSWFGLTSGNALQNPINLTEKGQAPPVGTYGCGNNPSVWTNTDSLGKAKYGATDGGFGGGDCLDWTSNQATNTHAGSFPYKQSPWWTDNCQLNGAGVCAKTANLYCLQQ
jgi:hypothetical protein